MSKDAIIVYTDGACSGNQSRKNVGGWGVVLKHGDHYKEFYGGERNTTNNRMEMTACIRALEAIKTKDVPIKLHSDSAYIVNCFLQKWYVKWRRNNWKTASKKPVENKDLWEPLLDLAEKMDVQFIKVKGHAGVELNERADELANLGMDEVRD